jgi:hypothetical protein
MLTIFAKDEIKQGPSTSLPRSRDKEGRTLAERLIPFYLSTLLEVNRPEVFPSNEKF